MKKNVLLAFLCLILSLPVFAQDNGGKISGQFFVDYFYNISRDGRFDSFDNVALDGMKDFNGFLLRRAAINYDHTISESFVARFRLEADSKSNASNNKIGVFVKDAYLKWKNIFKGSDLVAGIQPTPSFNVSEKYWGYRSLEKTIQDLRGYVASRDFGLSLQGNLSESGDVNYVLMIGNNSGNNVESNKYKRFYVSVDFMPIDNFVVAVSGDYKARPSLIDPNTGETKDNSGILGSLFLGYAEKNKYSFGVETVYEITQNGIFTGGNINPEYKNANSLGFSAFGSVRFSELVGALVRYDYYDPVVDDLFKGDSRNLIMAGVDFKPQKNVSIIPNVVIESYEEVENVAAFDVSVTGRVTLYYFF